ncbi:MAG: stage II sporulation protein D [Bacillota bacterium]|jgi:stage II sporulation protein D
MMGYRLKKRRPVPGRWFFLCLALAVLWLGLSFGEREENGAGAAFGGAVFDGGAEQTDTVTLRRCETEREERLPLEEYVVGVVAAEMPASFEPEALKAQAVIARTYALAKLSSDSGEEGVLCDDPGHCQAFEDSEDLAASWGTAFEEKYRRITDAVSSTEDMVLTYRGELARTYYHSTCGGETASAKEVWGEDIPYLRGVSCDWDRDAPRYRETVEIPFAEVIKVFGAVSASASAGAEGNAEVLPVVSGETESGRAAAVSCGGVSLSAADFRAALALNSTRFSWELDGETLRVTTLGFGHGVGLCQYGANGMAKEGKDFREILSHYYPGTELKKR